MTVATPTTPWIASYRPNPRARLRLFCFPYAGGGASVFRTWANDLPAEVDICAIQLPGRENRLKETRLTDMAPLLDLLAQGLRPFMAMPFAFFGHSMGAIVSFELARALRRQHGPAPVGLFVSGHRAPQLPDRGPQIHDLPDQEFVEAIRNFNGTPEMVLQHVELMQLMLPVLRADFTIVETYTYTDEEPLACPISAFSGLQDIEVSHEHLTAWRDQTYSSFTLRMFPGDHFFIHSSRTLVLQALTQDLHQLLCSL
jgi:medium-chain acyl-[acyl-carrier-protein] hydrolase